MVLRLQPSTTLSTSLQKPFGVPTIYQIVTDNPIGGTSKAANLDEALRMIRQHWPRIVILSGVPEASTVQSIRNEFVIYDKRFKIVCVQSSADKSEDFSLFDKIIPPHEELRRLGPICLSAYDISPSEVGGEDLRKHARVRVFSRVELLVGETRFEGEACNASLGGILFTSTAPLQKSDTVNISIFPVGHQEINTTIKVRRVFSNKQGTSHYGGEFTSLSDFDPQKIKVWLGFATKDTLIVESVPHIDSTKGRIVRRKRRNTLIPGLVVSLLLVLSTKSWDLFKTWQQIQEASLVAKTLKIEKYYLENGYFTGVLQRAYWDRLNEQSKRSIGSEFIKSFPSTKLIGLKLVDDVNDRLASTFRVGNSLIWILQTNRP